MEYTSYGQRQLHQDAGKGCRVAQELHAVFAEPALEVPVPQGDRDDASSGTAIGIVASEVFAGKIRDDLFLLAAFAEAKRQDDQEEDHERHDPEIALRDDLRCRVIGEREVWDDTVFRNEREEHADDERQRRQRFERRPFDAKDPPFAVFIRRDKGRDLAEPLRPVEERGRRAIDEDEEKQRLPRIDEGFHRGPLGNQHAERRKEHPADADHHAKRKARHGIENAIEILQIAAAELLLCGRP